MIGLQRSGVTCTLHPELGGSILSLCVHGFDVLRPAASETCDVLETACFPLVPFANRIAHGKMEFRGRQVVLPADPAAAPHAHHGHGWRRPWRLVRKSAASAEIAYQHVPDEWPWAYIATQRIDLSDRGLSIELSVVNLSDEAMPAGLGLHPYFMRRGDDVIDLQAQGMITNSSDGIPTGEATFVPGAKPVAAISGLDNLLIDGGGSVRLRLGGVDCHLAARGAAGFHVYVPNGEDFFCVEPVTHFPNAFALDAEQYALAPGANLSLTMRLAKS